MNLYKPKNYLPFHLSLPASLVLHPLQILFIYLDIVKLSNYSLYKNVIVQYHILTQQLFDATTTIFATNLSQQLRANRADNDGVQIFSEK